MEEIMKTLTTTKCLSLLSLIINISLSSPAIAKMDSYGVIENASLKILNTAKESITYKEKLKSIKKIF